MRGCRPHRAFLTLAVMDTEVLPQPGAHGWDVDEQGRHEMRRTFHLPPGPEGFSFALYQSTGVGLVPGH